MVTWACVVVAEVMRFGNEKTRFVVCGRWFVVCGRWFVVEGEEGPALIQGCEVLHRAPAPLVG